MLRRPCPKWVPAPTRTRWPPSSTERPPWGASSNTPAFPRAGQASRRCFRARICCRPLKVPTEIASVPIENLNETGAIARRAGRRRTMQIDARCNQILAYLLQFHRSRVPFGAVARGAEPQERARDERLGNDRYRKSLQRFPAALRTYHRYQDFRFAHGDHAPVKASV